MKATFVSDFVFCRCQVFWTYLFGDPEIGPHRGQNDGTFTVAGPVRTKSLFVKIFYQNHLEPVSCEHSLRKVGCKLICGDNGLKTASKQCSFKLPFFERKKLRIQWVNFKWPGWHPCQNHSKTRKSYRLIKTQAAFLP